MGLLELPLVVLLICRSCEVMGTEDGLISLVCFSVGEFLGDSPLILDCEVLGNAWVTVAAGYACARPS